MNLYRRQMDLIYKFILANVFVAVVLSKDNRVEICPPSSDMSPTPCEDECSSHADCPYPLVCCPGGCTQGRPKDDRTYHACVYPGSLCLALISEINCQQATNELGVNARDFVALMTFTGRRRSNRTEPLNTDTGPNLSLILDTMQDRASSTPSATTTTQALPIDALVPETWNASPPDSLPTAKTPGPVLKNDSDQVSQRAADIEQIITQTTLVPKKLTTTTTTTVQSVENTPFVQQPAGLSQQNGGQNTFVPEKSIKTRPSDNTLVSDAQPALIQSEQDFNQQTPIVAQMKAPATSVPTIIPPTVLPKNVFIPEVQPNIRTKPQGRGRRLRVRQWDD